MPATWSRRRPPPSLFAQPRHPYTRGLDRVDPAHRRCDSGRSGEPLRGSLRRHELPPGCPFAAALRLQRAELLRDQPPGAGGGAPSHSRGLPALARASATPAPPRLAPSRAARECRRRTAARAPGGQPRLWTARPAPAGCCRAYGRRWWCRASSFLDRRTGRPLRWSANPAAASRPSRGRSAGCCRRRRDDPVQPALRCPDPSGTGPPRQRRRIQYVFQNPDASLNPRAAGRQHPGAAARRCFCDLPPRGVEAARRSARSTMSGWMPLMRARYADQLSGGERQRVAIARALVAEPDSAAVRRDPLGARRLGSGKRPRAPAAAARRARDLDAVHLPRSRRGAVARRSCRRAVSRPAVWRSAAARTSSRRPSTPTRTACSWRSPGPPQPSPTRGQAARRRCRPGSPERRACAFAGRCPWQPGPVCHEAIRRGAMPDRQLASAVTCRSPELAARAEWRPGQASPAPADPAPKRQMP